MSCYNFQILLSRELIRTSSSFDLSTQVGVLTIYIPSLPSTYLLTHPSSRLSTHPSGHPATHLLGSHSVSGTARGAGGTFASKGKPVWVILASVTWMWFLEFSLSNLNRRGGPYGRVSCREHVLTISGKSTNGPFPYLQDSPSGKKELSTHAAGGGRPPRVLSPVPVKKVGY